jgi:hypothetical protein
VRATRVVDDEHIGCPQRLGIADERTDDVGGGASRTPAAQRHRHIHVETARQGAGAHQMAVADLRSGGDAEDTPGTGALAH